MPAWKNREAGRHGRGRIDGFAPYDERAFDQPRSRVERLTGTSASYGGGRRSHARGFEPQADEDLSAVANELDRMLSERSGRGERPRAERPAPRQRSRRTNERGGVMGALDRLDRRVDEYSETEDYADGYNDGDYDPHPDFEDRDRRYLSDPHEFDDRYADDDDADYDYDVRRRRSHDAPKSRRRRPDRRDRYLERDDRPDEETSHFYKDLGRRIDALRMPQEDTMNQVREEIGSLRTALGGLSRGASKTVSRQNEELRRLSGMIERLRADQNKDVLANEVRKEVAELKSLFGRVNVEGTLHTLENGYAHIVERLDGLSRGVVDPAVLLSVTDRLSEIEDAFAALPRSEHMDVLEDRVSSIADRLEVLLQRKEHGEIEPLRQELREVREFVEHADVKSLIDRIDERMKFVSGKLDDLEKLAKEQRGLDTRLSAMEDRMPESATFASLQGRLEDIVGMMSSNREDSSDSGRLQQVDERLNEIAARLERMEKAAPLSADTSAFDTLDLRLEQISSKIESIEKNAGHSPIANDDGEGGGNPLLLQLQERLNDLNQRLAQPSDGVTATDLEMLREEIGAMRDAAAVPISSEGLERRIIDLAQMISSDESGGDNTRIEQLGEKVAALATQIENTSRDAQDLSEVTSALDRIEAGLRQTREDVVDIAKAAAQEVAASRPEGTAFQYDAAISALQGDLKRLLDAAEGSDERARNTFEGVKSVLGSLSDRLENLERTGLSTSGEGHTFEPPATETSAQVLPMFSGGKKRAEGAGEEPRPRERTRDRKADFIAAARRAAQAASEEAAQLDTVNRFEDSDGPDAERGTARKSWFRGLMRRKGGRKTKEGVAADEAISEAASEAAYMEEASVPDSDEPVILAGDRPAPEDKPASGGRRRRAIIYTAAAVVLAIGALQVFKFANTPTGGENVTASETAGAPVAVAGPASNAENQPVTQTQQGQPTLSPAGQSIVPEIAPQSAVDGSSGPLDPSAAVLGQGDLPQIASGQEPEPGVAFAPPTEVPGGLASQPPAKPGNLSAGPLVTQTPAANTEGILANLPPEAVGPMALRTAAANGDPAAAFLVGVKYTEGDGVPADLGVAATWYQRAAEQGLAPAQYRLASLFEKGRGVERDIAAARTWYVKAAEAGNAKAMHNLAVLYAEGGGGAPDYNSAAKWFEAAANFGVKDSLFNLGILYAGGIGVQKDLVASYKWFAVAAEQGDPEAAKRRDAVANQMDQKTLADARLAVETFRLKTPIEKANKVLMKPEWSAGANLTPEKASVSPEQLAFVNLVREAQSRLNAMGFDTGTPDGQMGPKTRSAIRAFQRSLGLPETGEIDSLLMDELKGQSI